MSTASRCFVVVLALAVLAGTFACVAPGASAKPCSAYPTPGVLAASSASVPAPIARRYAMFRSAGAAPAAVRKLVGKLDATGIVASATHRLGRAGDRGVLYAVPAEHYLPYPIVPDRCLQLSQRPVERALLPSLRKDYAQPALCVLEVGGDNPAAQPLVSCAPLRGAPDAMLGTGATPLVGLAPDGVTAVTVRYLSDPPQTISVRHNFYEIVNRTIAAAPCGVQWLDDAGNITNSIQGCDYLPAELPLMAQYRSAVVTELATVQSDVGALAQAIAAGNLAQAQAAWLTAHAAWLAIGQDDGAYGCFGALGGEIDGTAAGHLGGTTSPDFTGFHRVELDLWTESDLTAAAADTATLQGLLSKLAAVPIGSELPLDSNGVSNWVLRPHEILEDALRDTLTGDDDYGSGSGMASVVADAGAVRSLLDILAPTLNLLAPHLIARADGELGAVVNAAQATQHDGSWVALTQISAPELQRVDADVGAALETLAPVPDLLTSTGRSAPTT